MSCQGYQQLPYRVAGYFVHRTFRHRQSVSGNLFTCKRAVAECDNMKHRKHRRKYTFPFVKLFADTNGSENLFHLRPLLTFPFRNFVAGCLLSDIHLSKNIADGKLIAVAVPMLRNQNILIVTYCQIMTYSFHYIIEIKNGTAHYLSTALAVSCHCSCSVRYGIPIIDLRTAIA